MIYRFFIFFCIISLVSLSLSWADSRNVELLGRYPIGSLLDIQVADDYAYLCAGGALVILDISNIEKPTEVGRITVHGQARELYASEGYAYIAQDDYGLSIIDVSDPWNPREVNFYDADASSVCVVGHYAYVAGAGRILILDIANPRNPIQVGLYEIVAPHAASKIQVVGHYAYAIGNYSTGTGYSRTLSIIDMADPKKPHEVGFYTVSDKSSEFLFDLHISGKYAYLANSRSGLHIIDVSNPQNPSEVGIFSYSGKEIYAVHAVGNYAYLSTGGAEGLIVIDISDPTHPFGTGVLQQYTYAWGIYADSRFVYMADMWRGLRIIDVSDPMNPYESGFYEKYGYTKIHVSGGYAYLAGAGLDVVDLNDPKNPIEMGHLQIDYITGYITGVWVSGDYVYVTDKLKGLYVIDRSNPGDLHVVGSCYIPDYAYRVAVTGKYAYVPSQNKVHVLDVSNPENPHIVGVYETSLLIPDYYVEIQVVGSYAYLNANTILIILDVSDPTNPREVICYKESYMLVKDLYVAGRYAYILRGNHTLSIIDISDPENPSPVWVYDPDSGPLEDIKVVDDYAYIAASKGLHVLDISDPRFPEEVGFYDTPQWVEQIHVVGSHIYMLNANTGLYILKHTGGSIGSNNSPIANPQYITTYENTSAQITLTGSDPDGDFLTFQIESQPGNGYLSGTVPNLTYHPNSGFVGNDSFTFTVHDGSVSSEPAIVTALILEGLVDAGKILKQGTWSDNDHKYVVVDYRHKTWDESVADMKALLGDDYYLATITSQEEQDFINSLMETITEDTFDYWLGGYQPKEEKRPKEGWIWVTGETWSYTNWWSPYEPNDYHGVASQQHLAIIWPTEPTQVSGLFKLTDKGKWDDGGVNLNVLYGYIAESGEVASQLTLEITYPTEEETYTSQVSPIEIRGTASDNVVSVTWENTTTGEKGACSGTKNWTCQVPLVGGNNVIRVVAKDSAGSVLGSDQINVEYIPLLYVPYIPQGNTNWCSLACITMVLRYYGIALNIWDLAKDFQYGPNDGLSGWPWEYNNIDGYLKKLNLETEWKTWSTLLSLRTPSNELFGWISAHLDRNHPIILYASPLDHAVVITGYTDDNDVFINDPSGSIARTFAGDSSQFPFINVRIHWSVIYNAMISGIIGEVVPSKLLAVSSDVPPSPKYCSIHFGVNDPILSGLTSVSLSCGGGCFGTFLARLRMDRGKNWVVTGKTDSSGMMVLLASPEPIPNQWSFVSGDQLRFFGQLGIGGPLLINASSKSKNYGVRICIINMSDKKEVPNKSSDVLRRVDPGAAVLLDINIPMDGIEPGMYTIHLKTYESSDSGIKTIDELDLLQLYIRDITLPIDQACIQGIGPSYGDFWLFDFHNAIDILCDPGTEVRAYESGKIVKVRQDRQKKKWDDFVVIEGISGNYFIYMHLDISVQENQTVEIGDVIGRIYDHSQFGGANHLFSHLHFGVSTEKGDFDRNDRWRKVMNPISLLSNIPYEDPPEVEEIVFKDQDTGKYYTMPILGRLTLQGRIDIIVKASDVIGNKKITAGVNRIGYEILNDKGERVRLISRDKKENEFLDLFSWEKNGTTFPVFAEDEKDPNYNTILSVVYNIGSENPNYNSNYYDSGKPMTRWYIVTNTNGDKTIELEDAEECWDTALYPDGKYTVVVKAWDENGHEETYKEEVSILNSPKSILEVVLLCKADLVITDPNGNEISKSKSEIFDAVYIEEDIDNNKDIDDRIIVPNSLDGQYSIRVLPEQNAAPTDVYTLQVFYNRNKVSETKDISIKDIPRGGYIFNTITSEFMVATDSKDKPDLSIRPEKFSTQKDGIFTVNIEVSKITDLFGASFELQFNGDILEATRAKPGDALGSDVVFLNMPSKGKISIAISKKEGDEPFSGSGTLATIDFKAKADGKTEITFDKSKLTLQKADGNPIPDFSELTITPCEITIGQVSQAMISMEPSGVQVKPGDEFTLEAVVSHIDGLFGASFEIQYDGNILEYVSSSAGDFMGSDVVFFSIKGDNTVNIAISMKAGADPASGNGTLAEIKFKARSAGKSQVSYRENTLALNHTDGTPISVTVSNCTVTVGEGIIKGDVNNDGNVRSNDAILTLRIASGLIEPTPEQRQAADMNGDGMVRSNDAILILREAAGLAAPGINALPAATHKVTVTLPESHGVAGERLIVPLKVDNADLLAGGDICITYDNTILRASGVESNLMLVSNIRESGRVHISFAGVQGLREDTLADIQFDILRDSVSSLEFDTVELYQPDALPLASGRLNGRFISWAIPPERSDLMQNYPNPFNPETWIPYQLRAGGEVTVRIHSITGELIRELKLGYKSAGLYVTQDRAAHWDGRTESGERAAGGVYFYTISAGDFQETKKLIMLN